MYDETKQLNKLNGKPFCRIATLPLNISITAKMIKKDNTFFDNFKLSRSFSFIQKPIKRNTEAVKDCNKPKGGTI
jgi:hypothetical protein